MLYKFKKLIPFIAFFVPVIALASWWNPFSFFEQKTEPITLGVTYYSSTQTMVPFVDSSYDIGTSTKTPKGI